MRLNFRKRSTKVLVDLKGMFDKKKFEGEGWDYWRL
jgi:hypothetical protein